MIVTSWLIKSASKDIVASIMYIDSAKHIWIDLHERFTQSNGPHIFHTLKKFATFTQDSASVSNYFIKLKMYWDDYNPTILLMLVSVALNAKPLNQ